MSNREQYKKAFSVLQASGDFTLGDEKMAVLKKKAMLRTFAAAACACLVIVGSSRIAYAANVGGIQRTIQLWMYGDQTDVTIDFDGSGNYSMEYTDADGNTRELGGGGFDVDADGTKRALTEDELIWHLFEEVDVSYNDDGRIMLYFQGQVADITDKFENDICYIFLNGTDLNGTDVSLYVTVLKAEDGGFPIASSPDRYLQYKETEPGIYTVY
jgi:hypothetical protein